MVPSHDIIPASYTDSLPWVNVPSNYTPNLYCNDINDGTSHFKAGLFNIVQIQEGIRYEYVGSGFDDDPSQNKYYRMGIAVYTITCGNQITYSGSRYFEVYDHNCLTGGNKCSNPNGSMSIVDLSKLNQKTWHYKTMGEGDSLTIPVNDIFTTLNGHHVTFPNYTFTGTPGKLARPLLLVHGLNSDFKVWGGIPVKDSIADPSFRAAKVKGYLNGTLPDMLQRSQNLDTNYDHNGIYFFQAPGGYDANKTWMDALPAWSNDSAASQSRALYGRIKTVLDDYFQTTQGLDWTTNDSLQIDLVCHSQGGLAVREMLRGLQSTAGFPTKTANAANHIHKIITVNSPHFGSALASDPSVIKSKFPGLSTLISDLDEPDTNRQLIGMKVDADTWTKIVKGTSAGIDAANPTWADGTPFPILGLITAPIGAIAGPFTDVYLRLFGPYLGPYSSQLYYDVPGPFNKTDAKNHLPDSLAGLRSTLQNARTQASYLGWNSPFIDALTNTGFPTRPDGSTLIVLPMFSDSTGSLVSALLGQVSKGATQFCNSAYSSEAGCFSLGGYVELLAMKYGGAAGVDAVSGVEVNQDLLNMLSSFQGDWLQNGDAVVEASSQTMVNKAAGLDTSKVALKPFFQKPRKYLIHDAQAPWEPVLHGPLNFSKNIQSLDIHETVHNPGATRMGSDLLCALYESCGAILTSGGSSHALLRVSANTGSAIVPALNSTSGLNVATQSLALTGDFNVQPVIADTGYHGVALRNADSSFRLVAGYQPGYGAYVWYIDDAGTAQAAKLTSGNVMANVSITRQGNKVIVTATNYSGKAWADTLTLSTLAAKTTLTILGSAGTVPASMLAGTGTATDSSTQTTPIAPAGNIWQPNTPATSTPVVVYHRESRNVGETGTSRPRFLVRNTSNHKIQGFKVAYYFTGDSARNPMVEFDYPHASFTQEHLGGDQWRFVIDASTATLDTGSYYPNTDGWQIRLHYTDWTEWNHWRDYSANQSMGLVKANPKIVVYALDGSILWGKEPTLPIDVTSLTEAGTIQVKDAAPWDTHSFKPQFTIQNTGTAPLANYHALYYFNVPDGKTLLMPAKNWSAKDASLSVNQVKGNLWALDVYFNKYILYPGQTIVEGDMGINLVDWSDFDKTQVGLILVDAKIKFLAGIVPSLQAYSSSSSSSSLPSSSSSSSVVTSSQLQVQIEDQSDVNYLRPRIKVLNQGSTSVSAFDLSFRFTSENGWIPLFDATWYAPNCSTAMNSFGNGLYSIDLHCTNLTLVPGSVWPNDGGATFGVHYGDWANWDKSNDPSMQGVTSAWTISTTTPITNLVSP